MPPNSNGTTLAALSSTRRSCTRFQPNIFSSSKCQNCYQQKECHSEEALENAKMTRKITACGFLYVAPVGLDFSHPSHSNKRWQRRFFTLYDDGELSFAVDDNVETIPQMTLNLNRCIRVSEADAITNHAHSILIAFKNELSKCETADGHPVIIYVKADTTEEIRRWQGVLCHYAKQQEKLRLKPELANKSFTWGIARVLIKDMTLDLQCFLKLFTNSTRFLAMLCKFFNFKNYFSYLFYPFHKHLHILCLLCGHY